MIHDRNRALVIAFGCLLALGAWACSSSAPTYRSDGGPDTDTTESCSENDPCGEHGACDDTSGLIQCVCEEGWAGEYCDECAAGWHPDGEECALDESCLPNSCDGHGSCDDSTGVVVCDCDDGYIGVYCDECDTGYHPFEDNCVADDSCQPDSCSYHGTCDDSTGVVTCACDEGWDGDFCNSCAPGYHSEEVEAADAGADGGAGEETCVLDQTCLPTSCDGHGACDDSSGTVVCDCDTGYTGQFCVDCDSGFHDEDGSCVADEACPEVGACNDHGTCDDSGGSPVCTCDLGWDGDTCDVCAAGFHDDGAGACVLDETCQPNTCDQHGDCDDSGSVVVCVCWTGYIGDFCDQCDDGYHADGGACVADEVCVVDPDPDVDSCSGNGVCDDTGGVVECQCDDGWTGDACSTCAAGYHDDAGDCVLDQTCLPGSCAYNGDCDDSGGVVTCACYPGYDVATYCADCADAFHYDVETDACVADVACETGTCNGHGDCDDSTGEPLCDCHDGWDGATCNDCAPGYHDDSGDCVLDQQCMPNSCSGATHGTCDDSSGEVVCDCNEVDGYTGTYCEQCLAGFHADGTDCVADEVCDAPPYSATCSGNGTCDDTGGIIECTCDYGWSGDTCNACAPGFHSDGTGGCELDESCLAGEASCSYHGTCDDSTGFVVCTCDPNFDEATYCAVCDAGYHLVGDACVANEDCSPSPCGDHGDCVLVAYEETCDCDEGWDGDVCDTCAGGFHDDGGDCVLDETCLAGSCSYHGTCDDDSGVVICTCNPGYDPAEYCADCASGYHWNAGACVVDETCTAGSCSGHGSCAVVGGEATCSCNVGYAGETCDACAPGFQDNDANGTCLVDCDLGTFTCDHGGVCEDDDGTAGCACASGWEGTTCATCSEDTYEDNDYDSGAYLLTAAFSASLDLCGTDKDWFAYYLAVGDTITANATFTHSSSGDVDLYLWYLYDSSPATTTLVDYDAGFTGSETVSYIVPSGAEGRYLIEVRGAGAFVRNDYNLSITRTGPGCITDCDYYDSTCGQWDDGCSGTLDCDPLCPGLGTTAWCELYQWGTCAHYLDDLKYGCCEGTVVRYYDETWDYDCADDGLECGWVDDMSYPPLTGYFMCVAPGGGDTPPPGVFATCPAGMTWAP